MIEIIMPQVGQDVATATIIEWERKVGDLVEKGDVVAQVESDKAVFDVEVQGSGVLVEILHQEGEEVEVLQPIAVIGEAGDQISAPGADRLNGAPAAPGMEALDAAPGADALDGAPAAPGADGPEATPGTPAEKGHGERPAAQTVDAPITPGAPQTATRRTVASPTARRLAREHDIDLGTIKGTGPGGRIVQADVEAALAAGEATGGAARETTGRATSASTPGVEATGDTIVPFTRIKQRMADHLTESKRSIPHFYLSVDVDMTEAGAWREAHNQSAGERITFTDLIVKAAAMALVEFPEMNAHVDKDRLILKGDINIGVATSVDAGLLVPVIPRADGKDLQEISGLSRQNTEAAKVGAMDLDHPGSFTITSLGMYGIREFVPIINLPQCAIMAVGAIEPRVVPISGGIGIREMATLTLAADHRGVDGVGAAEFLNRIRSDLESISTAAPDWVRGADQPRS